MDLCSVVVPVVILEAVGYLILWPVIKKKPKLRVPRQFSIADFAALLCYVQFAIAFAVYYRELLEDSIGFGVALSTLGIATTVLWGASVNMLNQLEMHRALRRMMFLLVLLPGVIAVMVGLPLGLILAAQSDFKEPIPGYHVWLTGGLAVTIVVGAALRYFAAWLVKDAKDPSASLREP